ncbi:thioesterase family protein [Nonomuraea sp. NPDC002799]
MSDQAYFRRESGLFAPQPLAAGGWAPNTVSGRLLGALAVQVLQEEQPESDFHLARLTVDLFRTVAFAPLAVRTTLVRKGGRIRVADAEISQGGEGVARAVAVFLRPSRNPPGEIWHGPRWEEAPPDASLSPANPVMDIRQSSADGSPEWTPAGRHRCWVRELWPLVANTEPTPLVRAALAADMASPLTNTGSTGLRFINTDFTLSLVRPPVGEFFGLEALDHQSADGISTGQATMYDQAGVLGSCAVTALASPAGLLTDPRRKQG